MDAMENLIICFELVDPVGENPLGIFESQELTTLYTELTLSGSESWVKALEAGALIEEKDIIDLTMALEDAVSKNVLLVFSNLRSASENHLRAFVRVLNQYGVDYTPVMLDIAAYNTIIDG